MLSGLLANSCAKGPERDSLRRHLRRASLSALDPHADRVLEQIFWEAPRPLLAGVVPTLRRRLADQWAAERPAPDDSGLRHRIPLRDFVPGTCSMS